MRLPETYIISALELGYEVLIDNGDGPFKPNQSLQSIISGLRPDDGGYLYLTNGSEMQATIFLVPD